MRTPVIIAEIANAHQGDPGQLTQLVEAAKAAGSDGIKFQWFKFDHLATPDYRWYPDYVRLFLDEPVWHRILEQCRAAGLEVWVDVLDDWGAGLAERYQDRLAGVKIPPTVALEPELPLRILRLGKPTLLGAGGHDDPAIERLLERFSAFRDQLILMHGFQGYPTKLEDAALGRIASLKKRFNRPVGYADHVAGGVEEALQLPVYAVSAGADVIEKHLCLDRSKKGYDYYSSLEPGELSTLVERIRRCRLFLGAHQISQAERTYLHDAATRAVAVRSLSPGDWMLQSDVGYRRTGQLDALLPDQMQALLPGVVQRTLESKAALTAGAVRKLRIVVLVVCRLKSTRLPQKALLPLYGVPSIERCLWNASAIRSLDGVVLATSSHPDDAALASFTLGGKVTVFRGAEDDVVGRFLGAADAYQADIVLRITGDCPVISYEIAELLIESHLRTHADCTYAERYAVGTASEVYTVQALRRLKALMPDTSLSEYMLFYFKNNPGHFKLHGVALPPVYQRPDLRLTLDEPSDLELFNRLFEDLQAGREPVAFDRVVAFFRQHPEASRINEHVILRWADDQAFVRYLNDATTIRDKTVTA